MPGGVAAFDYNGDGRVDLYFTNGASGGDGFDKAAPRFWNRLFRNDGQWGGSTDVTEKAGIAGATLCMGAAAGPTSITTATRTSSSPASGGRNQLFRNDGAGTLHRCRRGAQASPARPGALPCVWFDYDRDGRLDLFVVNYVRWTPGPQRFCGDRTRDLRVYCHPCPSRACPTRSTGTRATARSRTSRQAAGVIGGIVGKGMSGRAARPRWQWLRPSLYVTNDSVPSLLLRNTGARAPSKRSDCWRASRFRVTDTPISAMGVGCRRCRRRRPNGPGGDSIGRRDVPLLP